MCAVMPAATYSVVQVLVQGQLQWEFWRTEAGTFLAGCRPLKLTLEAERFGELLEDIELALDALLKEMFRTNDFDRFLRERGWIVQGPIPAQLNDVRFDVPFEVIRASQAKHGSHPQRHVH